MAKLADAPDLGSGGVTRAGSSPVIRREKVPVGWVRRIGAFYFVRGKFYIRRECFYPSKVSYKNQV